MEAELKCTREKREGIAVVGSYLVDAAGRIGVFIATDCGRQGGCDSCAVTVTGGAGHLSGETAAEREQLSASRRKKGERLSCQAKIISPGEITIMTQEPKKDERSAEEVRAEEYKKEFAALPLEKKIERLMELEAIAFGDTLTYVVNAPYAIGGKIVDLLAQYGFKIEAEEKKAKTPPEDQTGEEAKDAGEAKKPRAKSKPAKE